MWILWLQILSKCDWKRHVETVHEWNKPLKCEVCNHRLSRKGDLKKHVVASVHDGKNDLNVELVKKDLFKMVTWKHMLNQFNMLCPLPGMEKYIPL
jgi:hypothetical protein